MVPGHGTQTEKKQDSDPLHTVSSPGSHEEHAFIESMALYLIALHLSISIWACHLAIIQELLTIILTQGNPFLSLITGLRGTVLIL